MAMDWIKMRCGLVTDPRIARIAVECDCSIAEAIGFCFMLWCRADQHTDDGVLDDMTPAVLDHLTVKRFTATMQAIGWVEVTDTAIVVVDFERHNSRSARRRAMEATRKQVGRTASRNGGSASAKRTHAVRTDSGRGAPLVLESESELESESDPGEKHSPSPLIPDSTEGPVTPSERYVSEPITSAIWNALPRHMRKKPARVRDAIVRALRSTEAAVIADGIAAYYESEDGRSDWARQPLTFVTDEGWREDPEAWRRKGDAVHESNAARALRESEDSG